MIDGLGWMQSVAGVTMRAKPRSLVHGWWLPGVRPSCPSTAKMSAAGVFFCLVKHA